ncbi:hypothetical protein JIN84_19065 [Luteolibacter yonseiensis]|uniref:Uncharacterized protein n=1 Tax=Luteolibacter yonseiensis TaxID=1144680 RepID=A0A934R3I4_9BACT|nr:hypothetical protein [Luteolibacter yonseiensis]MBK1817728.1 hypothetical protein [Luteolibacter yonseiensis]
MNFFRALICLLLFASGVRAAEEPVPTVPKAELVPGVALSQGITEITGVAISPLLGVSSVGVWRYWHTPAEHRAKLPWYAQPWAWGTGFALLSLCFLKDSLGTAVPGLLKKPFDMVELFENKLSALVASSAFVPLVAHEMAKHMEAGRVAVPAAWVAGPGFAMLDVSWLMIPAAVVAFLVVWVCSHAINVLIILSPFSTLDALLKLARTAVLALVGVMYFIAPWLAAALCVGIILLAAWLAPAAMRFAIFGARYATDILLPWRARKSATPEQPHAFTLGRVAGLPPRTGGRVVLLGDGSMVFRYRRWCVLDERTVPLPDGRRHVEKGLFSPSLIHRTDEPEEQKLLLFLPRYRGHEERVVEHLKLHGVRDHAVARGFAAFKGWLKSLFRQKEGGAPVHPG